MALHDHLRELARREPERPHRVLRRRLAEALVAVLAVDVIGTVVMYATESGKPRSEIHDLWDAFFFSTVQLLTVSSQMPNPVTTSGRVMDIFLETVALVLVTAIAGAFASFYFHLGAEED